MSPVLTLYILGGAVAVAGLVFLVMIIGMIVRPPRLPDLTIDPPPPLERVIRALTPLPFASPTPVPFTRPSPVPFTRPSPVPSFEPAPMKRTAAPIAAPSPAPVPIAPPARTLPPRPPPISAPAPNPPPTSAPAPKLPRPGDFARFDRTGSPFRRPVYPQRRSRKLLRVAVGLFVTTLLAGGVVIAYPTLLDPLCDDYEWFGAESAQVVRDSARDAHASIAELVDSL